MHIEEHINRYSYKKDSQNEILIASIANIVPFLIWFYACVRHQLGCTWTWVQFNSFILIFQQQRSMQHTTVWILNLYWLVYGGLQPSVYTTGLNDFSGDVALCMHCTLHICYTEVLPVVCLMMINGHTDNRQTINQPPVGSDVMITYRGLSPVGWK